MADLELLGIEMETLWATDPRGRLLLDKGPGWQGRKAPQLVIAVSDDGQMAAIGSEVPDALAVELQAAVANGPATADPATQPASIARCEQLLRDSLGRVVLSASLAYVIPLGTAFQPAAQIVRSDGEGTETLRGQNPKGANWSPDEWQLLRRGLFRRASARRGANWSPDEWQLLLDGSFGPWAVAMVGKQIISICHSARLTDRGAEAGVWTDADFRGQGHAAAVTAAWASLLAPSGRHLFYSHSSTNLSSQRVAARLGLRPIGWRWQISTPPMA